MCSTCLKFKQFLLCCCVETRVVILPFSKEFFELQINDCSGFNCLLQKSIKAIVHMYVSMTRKMHQNELGNLLVYSCLMNIMAGIRGVFSGFVKGQHM